MAGTVEPGGSSLQRQVLNLLQSVDYAPVTAAGMLQQLGLSRDSENALAEAIDALIAGGRLRQDKRGRLKPRGSIGTVTGSLRKITSGAAYVIPSER
ncbi:MAG: Ribonuclease, partial [Planctomycetota bacterium]